MASRCPSYLTLQQLFPYWLSSINNVNNLEVDFLIPLKLGVFTLQGEHKTTRGEPNSCGVEAPSKLMAPISLVTLLSLKYRQSFYSCSLLFSVQLKVDLVSNPYVLQVQGDVPNERLDEPLLQPEPLLGFVKGFVFDL